jgi:CRP/FNR family cyclic AMP-dependent transcriptional regulator
MPVCFRKVTTGVRPGGLCAPLADSSAEILDGIEIFRNLAPDAVAALSRRCSWRRYAPGQLILQPQDESRDVFFVVSGRVSAVYHSATGREVRLSDSVAGDIFGDFAAIDGEPRSPDIVSVTPTLIASMSADLFWQVLRRHTSVSTAMLLRLTRIARGKLQRLVELSTLTVRSRVHAELLRLAQAAPGSQRASAVIAPAPTHADIASRIGTHREAVSREFSELARNRLIERRGSTLVIRDVTRLAGMVEEIFGEPCGEIAERSGSTGA